MVNAFHDLAELDQDECWSLLASAHVARVGISGDDRVDVLPVTHTVVGRRVAWLSAAGTKLGAAAAEQPVCVEVDDVDPETRTGWSVVVHGRARIVTDEAVQQALFDAERSPWSAADQRTLWIEVADPTISGRRVE